MTPTDAAIERAARAMRSFGVMSENFSGAMRYHVHRISDDFFPKEVVRTFRSRDDADAHCDRMNAQAAYAAIVGDGVVVPREALLRVAQIAARNEQAPEILTLLGFDEWEAAHGIAPDATGELSSEDFIRRQRDDWYEAAAPELGRVEGK